MLGVVEIDPEAAIGMQVAGGPAQVPGEVDVDSPVASFVALGRRAERSRAAEARAACLADLGTQTGPDVAQLSLEVRWANAMEPNRS